MKLPPLARALRHRNYRLFFFGQLISLVGTWMQQVAMTWLVYRLTGSAFYLGLVGFCSQIPTFFVAPVAGVLTDRWNLRRTLVGTQSSAMLQALALAILDRTHAVEVWQVIALSIALGIINAFDMPARQAFLVQMIEDKGDLGNAIALNSSMVNGARLVGPALAGLLIATAGEAMCFFLNAVSYVAVIAALLAMRLAPRPRLGPAPAVWQGLKAGFQYAFGFGPIRALLLLLGLVSLASMPLTTLLPVFAKDILHGGPKTLGFLTAASGVGALGGALYLASRNTILGLGKRIAMAAGCFGAGMILFSFSERLWLSMACLFVTGFSMMLQMAASNTLLQTMVDEDKRGRVMGLYATAFMGMAPLGSLLAGLIASELGTTNAVFASGLVCIAGASLFASRVPSLRREARPVLVRLGILPEIATGIQASTQLQLPPEHS